jgi:hypothetical protein
MATDQTRASQQLQYCTMMTLTVTTAKATTKGMSVIMSGNHTVEDATLTDDTIVGVAMETKTAGQRVEVAMLGPVIPMKVGTGDTTRGKKQIPVATGITDAPAHDSSGATDGIIVGIALESGVAGDFVGVMLTLGNRGSA